MYVSNSVRNQRSRRYLLARLLMCCFPLTACQSGDGRDFLQYAELASEPCSDTNCTNDVDDTIVETVKDRSGALLLPIDNVTSTLSSAQDTATELCAASVRTDDDGESFLSFPEDCTAEDELYLVKVVGSQDTNENLQSYHAYLEGRQIDELDWSVSLQSEAIYRITSSVSNSPLCTSLSDIDVLDSIDGFLEFLIYKDLNEDGVLDLDDLALVDQFVEGDPELTLQILVEVMSDLVGRSLCLGELGPARTNGESVDLLPPLISQLDTEFSASKVFTAGTQVYAQAGPFLQWFLNGGDERVSLLNVPFLDVETTQNHLHIMTQSKQIISWNTTEPAQPIVNSIWQTDLPQADEFDGFVVEFGGFQALNSQLSLLQINRYSGLVSNDGNTESSVYLTTLDANNSDPAESHRAFSTSIRAGVFPVEYDYFVLPTVAAIAMSTAEFDSTIRGRLFTVDTANVFAPLLVGELSLVQAVSSLELPDYDNLKLSVIGQKQGSNGIILYLSLFDQIHEVSLDPSGSAVLDASYTHFGDMYGPYSFANGAVIGKARGDQKVLRIRDIEDSALLVDIPLPHVINDIAVMESTLWVALGPYGLVEIDLPDWAKN